MNASQLCDCLWQEWIANDNVNTYLGIGDPGVTVAKLHLNSNEQMKDALMRPVVFIGNIKNIDGYTDNFYPGYLFRPSKINWTEDADCQREGDLKLLWYQTCNDCCVAKIKEGGRCNGLTGKDNAFHCSNAAKTPKSPPGLLFGTSCNCV